MLVRQAVCLITCVAAAIPSVAQTPPSLAPDRTGWLVLEGGGRLRGTDIVTRFVALAGGPTRHIVMIPTAISDSEWTPARLARCETRSAEIFGVPHVTCLDARSRAEANSAAFLGTLRRADAVWFYGGDEGRLVDRYVGTAAAGALADVLHRGGVLGGTSAGAMIMASFIPARAVLRVSGFGFLARTTIAPHYSQRHYEAALRADVARRPGIRGIGIDEDTALIVHGNDGEVIGTGMVTVIGQHVTTLHAGNHLDLRRDTVAVAPPPGL